MSTSTLHANAAVAFEPGQLGIAANLDDLKATRDTARLLNLGNMLPADTWERISKIPGINGVIDRVNNEILFPIQIERERLMSLTENATSSKYGSQETLLEARKTAQEIARHLSELTATLHDELVPAKEQRPRVKQHLQKSDVSEPDDVKVALGLHRETLYRMWQGQMGENTRLLVILGKALDTSERNLGSSEKGEIPTVLAPRRSGSFFPDATPLQRLADNPLRDAVAGCTYVVGGKASREMLESAVKLFPPSDKLHARTTDWIDIALINEARSILGTGYFKLSSSSDELDQLLRKQIALVKAETNGRAHKANLNGEKLSGTPVGLIDISFSEPEKKDGVGPALRRGIGKVSGGDYVEMRVSFMPSTEIDARGHQRADTIHGNFAIVLTAAIPSAQTKRIVEDLKKGDARVAELVHDLMEYPPDVATRWIRSGLFEPLLTTQNETPIGWASASAAQKKFAFSHYVVSTNAIATEKLRAGVNGLCVMYGA